MSERITVEIVRVGNAKSVSIRGSWQPFGNQPYRRSTASRRVSLPEGTKLGEQEVWELLAAIEGEISGWQAKLPLDY